jgi:hypothetical protein
MERHTTCDVLFQCLQPSLDRQFARIKLVDRQTIEVSSSDRASTFTLWVVAGMTRISPGQIGAPRGRCSGAT